MNVKLGIALASDLKKVLRIAKDQNVFYSEDCTRMKKRNPHAVLFKPDEEDVTNRHLCVLSISFCYRIF